MSRYSYIDFYGKDKDNDKIVKCDVNTGDKFGNKFKTMEEDLISFSNDAKSVHKLLNSVITCKTTKQKEEIMKLINDSDEGLYTEILYIWSLPELRKICDVIEQIFCTKEFTTQLQKHFSDCYNEEDASFTYMNALFCYYNDFMNIKNTLESFIEEYKEYNSPYEWKGKDNYKNTYTRPFSLNSNVNLENEESLFAVVCIH